MRDGEREQKINGATSNMLLRLRVRRFVHEMSPLVTARPCPLVCSFAPTPSMPPSSNVTARP